MLRRKIDTFLEEWKLRNHKPLLVYGARQIGKTTSIEQFGKMYSSFIEINLKLDSIYIECFKTYNVGEIIQRISLYNPEFKFIPNDTLIFIDEIQEYPDALTSFKSFALDGRFDVIASGSLLGIHYKKISSIPVGFKEEYLMHSMDFEEFLWAKGYDDNFINALLTKMIKLEQLDTFTFNLLDKIYTEYIYIGGLPEVVDSFISEKTYHGPFAIQKRIYNDYEDDIIKYVEGLDVARVKNFYRNITSQLAKDNHKFQITKLNHGARSGDYIGCQDWLLDAGIINAGYNIKEVAMPFELYKNSDNYRIYYQDHGLFIASLDEEDRKLIMQKGELEIYNGALYESLISADLAKQGYKLYFYRNETAVIELDFLIRVLDKIIPIEVKKRSGRPNSVINCINDKNINISKAIKLSHQNIGYNNEILTLPYFLTFLLKRFLEKFTF